MLPILAPIEAYRVLKPVHGHRRGAVLRAGSDPVLTDRKCRQLCDQRYLEPIDPAISSAPGHCAPARDAAPELPPAADSAPSQTRRGKNAAQRRVH